MTLPTAQEKIDVIYIMASLARLDVHQYGLPAEQLNGRNASIQWLKRNGYINEYHFKGWKTTVYQISRTGRSWVTALINDLF